MFPLLLYQIIMLVSLFITERNYNVSAISRSEKDCLPNINWVLQLAKAAVLRHGVNGLVIDPYNELDHQRNPSQ